MNNSISKSPQNKCFIFTAGTAVLLLHSPGISTVDHLDVIDDLNIVNSEAIDDLNINNSKAIDDLNINNSNSGAGKCSKYVKLCIDPE